MYLNFYGFRAEPFHITSDPAFLYLSPSHKEALGAIVYGISRRKGFVAVTGEVGVGKTTILRAYLEGADISCERQDIKIIFIFNANLTFDGLLQTMCRELDRAPPAGQAYEIVSFLHSVLIEEYGKGHTIVLVVDEAQNMPLETLENLRMLSNLETSREKLLQIVLVGQPEFDSLLNRPQIRQLNQRIAIRARIRPLTRKESVEYLYHRLSRVTDTPEKAFLPSALRLIARHGLGTPRVLNILSDNALIAGFGYQKKPVTPAIVREAIADYRGHGAVVKRLRWALVPAALALLTAGLLSPAGKDMVSGMVSMVRVVGVRTAATGVSATGPGPASRAAALVNTVNQMPPPAIDPVPEGWAVRSEENPPVVSDSGPVASGVSFQSEPQVGAPLPETASVTILPMKPPSVSLQALQPVRYVVRSGENLIQISRAIYGVYDSGTLKWILAQNPQIQDPNRLRAGDNLLLPVRPGS